MTDLRTRHASTLSQLVDFAIECTDELTLAQAVAGHLARRHAERQTYTGGYCDNDCDRRSLTELLALAVAQMTFALHEGDRA